MLAISRQWALVIKFVYQEIKEFVKGSSLSDMFVYCFNKEQNSLNREYYLNFHCKVVSCAKMSKQ